MNTLLGHFKHYYRNQTILIQPELITLEENKFLQAVTFGMFHQQILSINGPITFVTLHRQIPAFDTLPTEQQNAIRKLDAQLESIKDFLLTGSWNGAAVSRKKAYEKFVDYLDNNNTENIKDLLDAIRNAISDFLSKIETVLSDFEEIYQ